MPSTSPDRERAPVGASGFSGPDVPPKGVYDQCVRCGLCLPTCPTYVETLVETSGPRGRIALIKAVDEGRLDLLDPGFTHQMSECLDCRACSAVCPSGVDYGALLEPARTQIERASAPARSPVGRAVRGFSLDFLFSNLGAMRLAGRALRFYQRSGIRTAIRASGVLRLLGLARLEAMAPEMSEHFFVPRDQTWPSGTSRTDATVFLHAGCVAQIAFAPANDATVRVLQRASCAVVAPSGQGCCGAIAVHAGDMELGRTMARANIEAFERSGADVYVANAAGCGAALKEYGHLFADVPQWAERARAFSARVRDVSEYLDTIDVDPRFGPVAAVATYQEPCHLAHAQRIAAAPRRLLARIPNLELREMAESSLCCGSAGVYNLTQPEMAARLQRRKTENALAVKPSVVVTANPGCALQLANGLRDASATDVRVMHVVELLDESYANYKPTSRA